MYILGYVVCGNVHAGACFSRVRPTPLTQPKLVAHSQSALDLLGLASDQVEETTHALVHVHVHVRTRACLIRAYIYVY